MREKTWGYNNASINVCKCKCIEVTCFAAASSSWPSPTTTYVHFLPNLETILSKQLSLPVNIEDLITLSYLKKIIIVCSVAF